MEERWAHILTLVAVAPFAALLVAIVLACLIGMLVPSLAEPMFYFTSLQWLPPLSS